MKSGILSCFLLCCLFLVPYGIASDQKVEHTGSSPDIAEVLSRLAKKVSAFATLKTDFVQEKELALFQNKLVLKGRIYLRKPSEIAWHVDHPVRYSVLITDKLIRQWDAETNKVQEISLAKNPVFQSVLGQLTVWFSGDYSALLKDYEVRVLQNKPVVLECTPRESSITRKVIKRITLTFREDQTYLQKIKIVEEGGDTTTIIFVNTLLNPRLDQSHFEVRPAQSSRFERNEYARPQEGAAGRIRTARVSG